MSDNGNTTANEKKNSRNCAFDCDGCSKLCACAVCHQPDCSVCVCRDCTGVCDDCECSICEEDTCIGCINAPDWFASAHSENAVDNIGEIEETEGGLTTETEESAETENLEPVESAEESAVESAEEPAIQEVESTSESGRESVFEQTEETTAEVEEPVLIQAEELETIGMEEVAEDQEVPENAEESGICTASEEICEGVSVPEEITLTEEEGVVADVEPVSEQSGNVVADNSAEAEEEQTAETVDSAETENNGTSEAVECEQETDRKDFEEPVSESAEEPAIKEVESTSESVQEPVLGQTEEATAQTEEPVSIQAEELETIGLEETDEEAEVSENADDLQESANGTAESGNAEPIADNEEADREEHKRMIEELKTQLAIPPRRRYIAAPKEIALIDEEYTVDCPAKSEMKENVQAVFKALIKEGVKLGYLDKYDGLSASEIKEEYEGELVYEVAEQELKKVALKVCTVKKETKVGVYAFSWDGSDVHHIGYLNEPEKAEALIPYLNDKDNYIFNVCGIITGGKYKSVELDEKSGKIKIKNCEGLPYGIELDIAVYKKLS